MQQSTETTLEKTVTEECPGDVHLKKKLLDMAARRSAVVRNGRFFFSRDLNALTYWYEDHTDSTRMVYVKAEG